MAWFEAEDSWIIVRPGELPPSRERYTLGFAVRDPGAGQMIKVHCLADRIEETQRQRHSSQRQGGFQARPYRKSFSVILPLCLCASVVN